MSGPRPGGAHLRLLRNLEAKRPEMHGFLVEENGMKAYFECVLNGWVDRGQLTAVGRELLAQNPVALQQITCTVLSASPELPTKKLGDE